MLCSIFVLWHFPSLIMFHWLCLSQKWPRSQMLYFGIRLSDVEIMCVVSFPWWLISLVLQEHLEGDLWWDDKWECYFIIPHPLSAAAALCCHWGRCRSNPRPDGPRTARPDGAATPRPTGARPSAAWPRTGPTGRGWRTHSRPGSQRLLASWGGDHLKKKIERKKFVKKKAWMKFQIIVNQFRRFLSI